MRIESQAVTTRSLGDLVAETGAFPADTPLRVRDVRTADRTPDVAFVVPVHDQAGLIAEVLDSIFASATRRFELVVILDDCTDGSDAAVEAWAARLPAGPEAVTIVDAPDGIFETLCDAVGVALTTAPVVIEVQADMVIHEPGFDDLLLLALEQHPDVFAVSGRGAHAVDLADGRGPRSIRRRAAGWLTRRLAGRSFGRGVYRPSNLELRLGVQIGRCADLIDLPLADGAPRSLYLHETVMRGPLAFKRGAYEAVGGFDTRRFFLGDDDHDLMSRVWEQLGLRVGFVPLRFDSPLDAGTTRRPRPPAAQRRLSELRAHYATAQADSFLRSGRRTRALPRPEVRPIGAHRP